MASIKVTFTLDPATIARLQQAAERLSKPKSVVVREAIQDFHGRIGRLSEQERLRMLDIFDQVVPKIPRRPEAESERELRDIIRARRAGGRRSAKVSRR